MVLPFLKRSAVVFADFKLLKALRICFLGSPINPERTPKVQRNRTWGETADNFSGASVSLDINVSFHLAF